jgi:hypothetical protein
MVAWQLPATSVAGFTRLIEVGGGAILGSIIVMFRRSQESKPDSARRLLRPTLGYAFLVGALIIFPLSSGAIHAWKECSLGNVSLPRVSLKGDTRKWVLLLQAAEHVHLVDEVNACPGPVPVRIRDVSEVDLIVGPSSF